MCLSVPALILSVEGDFAAVSVGGTVYRAAMHMVPDAAAGEYVLLHAGFAIQKIDEAEARATLELLNQLNNLQTGKGLP